MNDEKVIEWLEKASELLERTQEAFENDLLPNVSENFDKNHQLYLDILHFNKSVWRNE